MTELTILYDHVHKKYLKSIPERTGAYVICHTYDNICVEKYVGSTINLHKRIYGHFDKNILYVDLYITDDIKLAESLERVLMKLIKPATNLKFLHLSDKDKDLIDDLLNDDISLNYILNKDIKIGYRYLKYIIRNNESNIKNKTPVKDKSKSIHLKDDMYLQLNEIKFDLKKIGIEKTLYEIHGIALRNGIKNTFEIIKQNKNKEEST